MEITRIQGSKKALVTIEDANQEDTFYNSLPRFTSIVGLRRVIKYVKDDFLQTYTAREVVSSAYPLEVKISRRELGFLATTGLISKMRYKQVVIGSASTDSNERPHLKLVELDNGLTSSHITTQPFDYETADPELSKN